MAPDPMALLDVTPPRIVRLALLQMTLEPYGLRVQPPLLPGGHAYVVFRDGTRCSVTRWEAYVRAHALNSWRCAGCGTQAVSCNGRARGQRVDRRWCSAACRQRAYRRRQRQPDNADSCNGTDR